VQIHKGELATRSSEDGPLCLSSQRVLVHAFLRLPPPLYAAVAGSTRPTSYTAEVTAGQEPFMLIYLLDSRTRRESRRAYIMSLGTSESS
jgi:hypothetical protein